MEMVDVSLSSPAAGETVRASMTTATNAARTSALGGKLPENPLTKHPFRCDSDVPRGPYHERPRGVEKFGPLEAKISCAIAQFDLV